MNTTKTIDENRFSRQIMSIGIEAMKRLANSKILLIGCSGLGAEIAKNLILMGISELHLYDTQISNEEEIGINFFLEESKIGESNSIACLDSLSQLNKNVKVEILETLGNFENEFIVQYNCVISSVGSLEDKERLNERCHSNNIPFFVCGYQRCFCLYLL